MADNISLALLFGNLNDDGVEADYLDAVIERACCALSPQLRSHYRLREVTDIVSL